MFFFSLQIGRSCHNDNKQYYMASSGLYLSSLLVMTVIYLKILFIAIEHAKAISKTTHFSSKGGDHNKVTLPTSPLQPRTDTNGGAQIPSKGRKKVMR